MFDLGNATHRHSEILSGSERMGKLAESYSFYASAEAAFEEVDGNDSINFADAGVLVARHVLRYGEEHQLPSAR